MEEHDQKNFFRRFAPDRCPPPLFSNSFRRHCTRVECFVDSVLTWRVSWLSSLAVIMLSLVTLALYAVPLRYVLLVWGLVKFTAKLRHPRIVHHVGLIEFLARAPSSRQLVRTSNSLSLSLSLCVYECYLFDHCTGRNATSLVY